MSRTIRTFIDSDRLSAELDPVLVLDAPITAALIGAASSAGASRPDTPPRGVSAFSVARRPRRRKPR